jgi:hypothetical protein
MAKTLEKDNFYIFDVGQGNCQLVIYGEEKIGFLYDCGSKAYKKNRRVSLGDELWRTTFKDGQSLTSEQNTTSHSLSLKEILSELKFCFVFLSHADEDHISLVNKNNFPKELHVVFFLGGNFLRKNTENVKSLLRFFIARTRDTIFLTWVEFPYYWSGNDNAYTYFKYFLLNSINKHDHYDFTGFNVINEDNFFQGSFFELLTKLQSINRESSTFQEAIEKLNLEKNTNLEKIFKEYVHIFAMNQKLKDFNAQSTVVSFMLPYNNIQLICTGDAHNETFNKIKRELDKTRRTKEMRSKFKDMEKILIIPHHGSSRNHSDTMIELFKPTIYVISAGSGTHDCHPHKDTYNTLNGITKDKTNNITFYHDKAIPSNGEIKPTIIVYSKEKDEKSQEEKKKEENGYFIKGKIPVLGTNAMGTIYIQPTMENLNINESGTLQMKEIRDEIENILCNDHKENILKSSLPKSSNVFNKEKSNEANDEDD